MLNVLIADDESKVCQLIKTLVDWEALGMRVIATAENGIEALEKIRELNPDIAITDIRMPGYDGLELVRLSRETNPRTEFIIISGYRHFEYAQSAIRYGVNSYLLKPIKKDELTDTLKKLGEKLRERTRQLSYEEKVRQTLNSAEEPLRQTFLADLISRRDKTLKTASPDRINQDFHYGLRPGNFCLGILKLDGHVFDDAKNLHFMADKVRGVMDRLLPECTFDYELLVSGSFFYFLLNFAEDSRSQIRRQMKALFDEVRIQGGILKDFAATLSIGTVCGGLDGLDASLKSARLLIEERLVAGTGKLLEGELPCKDSFADSALFAEFNSRMSQALESLDVHSVREALTQLKN
ncbi:MAG: response regulator, partial [Clostridium sp.]|nr:response regulator [Clostridium sp.]